MPVKLARTLLASTAVVALAATTLTACNHDGSDAAAPKAHPFKPHYVAPGPQDVPGPKPSDRIDLTHPVAPAKVKTPKKPNLLMITVDDATRSDMAKMPYLQHLIADQGVTLDNGIAPSPVCVPARASLLTGQTARHHGALTISGEGGGFQAFKDAGDDDTLPVWLQHAGYRTMFVGKYLNHYGEHGSDSYIPPGWDDWRPTIDPYTYSFTNPVFNENGERKPYDRYVTYVERDLSNQMIAKAGKSKKPWYLWVNQVAPHHGGKPTSDDPAKRFPNDPKPLRTTTPAETDRDTFKDLPLPKKPSMFEKDTSDKAIGNGSHRRWPHYRRQEMKEVNQQRVESLQAVDRAIRSTVGTLRRTGQLDDTYIVVTSDNGYAVGEHNLSGKLWYFHEIVNIPMYIRGPGLPHGVTSHTPVSNLDWAPTFAAMAGAKPTRTVDGVDVLPYLTTHAARRIVPLEGYPIHGGRKPNYTGIVFGPWTYVTGKGGRSEMYYRTVDPFEDSNLNRDPRYAEQRRTLKKLAERYVDCAGSECPREFYP